MASSAVELAWSAVVSLVLVGLGTYYMVREVRERRRQGSYGSLPPVDRDHFRWQFYRRAAGSSLLIAAGIAIFIGQGVLDWTRQPLLYFSVWLGVLFGLFGVVCLAGADIVGIQRYARRQRRKLEADRREMISRQLEQYQSAPNRPQTLPPDFDVQRN